MSTRPKYSREEDEAIFRAVKDSETSLKTCFIALAEQLNRTPGGIAYRWYNKLSNPQSDKYMGTAMLLLKQNRAAQNRTNFKFPVETRSSIWATIKRLLHL